jgi:hypothetical protein
MLICVQLLLFPVLSVHTPVGPTTMPTLVVAKIKPTMILPIQPLSVSTIMVVRIREVLQQLDREVYPMSKSKCSFLFVSLFRFVNDFSLCLLVQI